VEEVSPLLLLPEKPIADMVNAYLFEPEEIKVIISPCSIDHLHIIEKCM